MFDFCGKRRIFYGISIVLIIIAFLSPLVFGAKLDIQFKGGSILTYSYTGDIDKAAVQKTIETALSGEPVTLQESTDITTGMENIVVSLTAGKSLSSDTQMALTDALVAAYPEQSFAVEKINNVDPTIGKEFFAKCLVALALSAVLMCLYIAVRFRKIGGWVSGGMCVAALVHDVIMVFAAFIFCGFSINENFIAITMTIVGYSINATIVIYDRIRENEAIYGKTISFAELVNKSVNQTMRRTIFTTFTTAMAMTVVCIIGFVLKMDSILSFAFPLIIGILSGLYSSLCIAPTLWVEWQEHHDKGKGKGKGKSTQPTPKSI